MSSSVIVWLKRDLRVHDHPALHRGLKLAREGGSGLILLYVYEPVVIGAPDFDTRHLAFINYCLRELEEEVGQRGGQLIIKKGKIRAVLAEILKSTPISDLISHEEAGHSDTFARDLAVAEWCQHHQIRWTELPQNGVIRRLKSRDGWAKRWLKRMNKPLLPSPAEFPPTPPLSSVGILSSEQFGLLPPPEHIQRGGTRVGRGELESFLSTRGMNYTRGMSSPNTGFHQCSRISPYLSWGALSVRECHHAAVKRTLEIRALKKSTTNESDKKDLKLWAQALRSFSGRLRWHCHFMQKLEDLPTIHEQNFARFYDGVREEDWREDYFQAWKEGRTGYPLVDACMRAVAETGYLNFRMRAMVMSFASYHLWLHWRETGLHLARMFTDYEPGIHWSQVQMQSGTTGINTVRVYSPIKQTEEHDPEGTFIKHWVPELKNLPASYLAEPWETPEMEQLFAGCIIGKDYPAPIVDHKTAYKHAQETIRGYRKSDNAKKESDAIQHKHGSRRQAR